MKSNRFRLFVGFAIVAVGAILVARSGDEAPPSSSAGNVDEGRASQSQGMIVHIDPETGERLETAPDDSVFPPAAIGSDVELVEEPAPGGGVMIQVGDRFHQSSVATVGDSGGTTIKCVPKGQAADSGDASHSHPDGGGSER